MKIELSKKTKVLLVIILLVGIVGASSEYGNNVNIPGVFNGNGAGLTNMNATNQTTGTLADARLPQKIHNITYVENNASITLAIANLTAGRTWKETIIVLGENKFGDLITIPSNTVLDLRNANLSWLGSTGSGTKMFDVSGNDVEIYGGNSRSNGADYHAWLTGNRIKLFGGNYSGFVSTAGLFKISGTTIEVTGITARNDAAAIGINVLNNASDVNIHDNFFYDFSDNSVDSGSSDATSQLSKIKVNHNLISGGSGGGISFYSNITNSEAIGNTIINKGSRCFRISNQNGYGDPINIKISNNQCINFTYAAVWLQGSENAEITDNQFQSSIAPAESAILLDTVINKNTTISNNHVEIQKQGTHLNLRVNGAKSQNLTVTNNEFIGGAGTYYINANYSDVSYNIFKDNFGFGLEIEATTNMTAIGNRLYNTGNTAIKETLGSSNNIYLDTIIRDSDSCITLLTGSSKNNTFCNGVYTP